ncbi:MAG: helix-turn-helix transcriptional regulator [Polyangiaceae bacterium]|nr:helix-turn-helix transcriptional regulator [Polyangiaceae bacterium]
MSGVHQPPNAQAVGHRIESLLAGLGQTAAWLAERAGVERSTVTRIVRGERHPTPETIALLAPVLGVTVEQLVAETDAADRVDAAKQLVSKAHYDEAVRQVIEYERRASDLGVRVRDLQADLNQEQSRRRDAVRVAEERDRDARAAERRAASCEHDAQRYRDALERAVSDVARLQTKVQQLSAAVDDGRRHGRVAATLAGVAAVASVASYLATDSTTPKSPRTRSPSAKRKTPRHA